MRPGAPQVGAGRAAIAGSVELPMVFVVGLALGEAVSGGHLLAALLIGIAIIVSATSRPAYAIPGEDLGESARSRPDSSADPDHRQVGSRSA